MNENRLLTQKEKFTIAYRDNFACRFCGDRPGNQNIEIEHLIPVSKGGSDNPENLVAACVKCNRNKGDLVMFPAAMIEGRCTLDDSWFVHRSFGAWQVKVHPEGNAVLEYTRLGYYVEGRRAHDQNFADHISRKQWEPPHNVEDFWKGITYFRKLIKARIW
jgi:hypothetical protein